jgi:diguanylate cyclase
MHVSHHHPVFVVLSLAVAVLGSWTALDLLRRVRTHLGRARRAWLAAAALAMGCSIWSMHFVAMLGFDPGLAVGYDPVLTFLSLLLAVASTGGAFIIAVRDSARAPHLTLAGAAMGAGICLMHYVGMAAVQAAVSLTYEPRLVLLSLAVAVSASIAALFAARHERSVRWRMASASILGLAVVGMHYTAMAALRLTPAPHAPLEPPGGPPVMLAMSVAGGTLLILVLALMASLYDQRGNILSALEAGGVGYWELDLAARDLQVSAHGREILGLRPDRPASYADWESLLTPEDRQRREQALETALRTGGDFDAEYRLADQSRWVNIRGRVARDATERPRRMIGVVLDVTDRHEAFAAVSASERRQRLLINELNHRVKNTLATVQSVAAQTARRSETIQTFQESFDSRLIALSATHNALTRGGWEGASLREILHGELEPYGEERWALEGQDVHLEPRRAISLGMVFHELATNAAKYGALSGPEGRVVVSWALRAGADAPAFLELSWREAGGPPVRPPSRRGFGSRLIGAMEVELAAQVELRYEPGGVSCTLRLPQPEPIAGREPFAI